MSRTFAIDELFTFVLAIVAIMVGIALNARFAIIRKSNVPPAVSGGLLFAVLAALLFEGAGIELQFGGIIRGALLLIFFAGLGLAAKFSGLKRGGREVALMCVIIAAGLIAQNIVGVALAHAFSFPPGLGLFVGSISFLGGHGTAAAWSQAPEAAGLPGAFEIGIGAATLGLIAGGLIAGPVATALAKRARPSADAPPVPATESLTGVDAGTQLADILSSDRWLKALLLLSAALAIGQVIQRVADQCSVTVPGFLAAMFGGIILTNLADIIKRPVDHHIAELVSTIALRLFLAMSMLSLKIWVLAAYAGLMAAAVVAQGIVIVMLGLILFFLMRRDHDAAVATGGFIGFGMGAMPVGLGTMRRIADSMGPAPRAFLVVTLAASLFLDTANALTIDFFFGHVG
jgi:ESS family glutamate:Na+ symporter